MLEPLQRTIATEIQYHEKVKGRTCTCIAREKLQKCGHVVFDSLITCSLVPSGWEQGRLHITIPTEN